MLLHTPTGTIAGTLEMPERSGPVPVVLIIAGSGPTDRNGNSPLIPGANNSLKLGGTGSNLLIGGRGADTLVGNDGDDILISGFSDYSASPAALDAVLAEWGRTDADYLTRSQHLSGSLAGGLNGSTSLTPLTVRDDGAVDQLTGSAGLDWFFWGGGSFPDRTTDWSGGEIRTHI